MNKSNHKMLVFRFGRGKKTECGEKTLLLQRTPVKSLVMPLCSLKSQGSFRALNEMCTVKQRFIFPVWFFSGLHHLRSLSTSLHRSACHSCHKRKKNWKREICRRRLHYNSGSFHSSERPRNSGLRHKWYFVFSVKPVVFALVLIVVACLLMKWDRKSVV